MVGLLGPNGAGKTTCFYMIVGLVTAGGGEITLDDDRDLTHRPIHQRARLGLSYLPQEMSVFRKLTVAENIQAVLELQDERRPQIAARLEELLANSASAPARQHRHLPVGRRARRCEIARALATDPRLILLDEPFAGVDPIAVIDIQKIIRFLKDGHRRPDHRPQRPRDPRHLRPRLHHQRRRSAGQRPPRRDRRIMSRSVRFISASTSGSEAIAIMKPSLQLKLSQHLALTPQLQQSIKLLQLSTIELNQEIEKVLLENPMIEREGWNRTRLQPRRGPRPVAPAGSEAAQEREQEQARESDRDAQADQRLRPSDAAGMNGRAAAAASGRR